jgi:tetrapyrrole methylase family protein/MazG family protein
VEEFSRLVALMASLRGDQGCPWDKKQTEKAFRTFLLEETYEVIDAIEQEDYAALKEELGDLLFHIVFIAQICKEKGLFEIVDVINSAYTKMYNRHPHVFRRDETNTPIDLSSEHSEPGTPGYPRSGSWVREAPSRQSRMEGATRAPEIEVRWEELKRAEKADYTGVSSVPRILPALLRAYVVSKRAARIGFDWGSVEGIYEKIAEEIGELKEAEKVGDTDLIEEEVGDLLFTVANLSRFHNIDPEAALRRTLDKFVRRFLYVEKNADLNNPDPKAMDDLWNEVKDMEKRGK